MVVGILVLCYITRIWNKKHKYSKLDNQQTSKSPQKSATIRPDSPPQFSFYTEQQSSRVNDPPIFDSESFKSPTKESNFEFSASAFKKFNPVDGVTESNDLFSYDENRSFKSSGSEYDGGSSYAESMRSMHSSISDKFDDKPMKLSKKTKNKFKSEPILNSSRVDTSSKWRKFSRSRSKAKFISLTEPVAGQLEFTLFYDSDDRLLVINISSLSDVVLKPESFVGILDVRNRTSERESMEDSMHLIRNPNETLTLGGVSETGYLIYVTLSPKRSFIKHTDTIFCEGNAVFNEKFTIHGQSIEQLSNSYLCLHVLCKFGRECDPIVLGEVKVPLKRLQVGQLLPFVANIMKPEDEILLEVRFF